MVSTTPASSLAAEARALVASTAVSDPATRATLGRYLGGERSPELIEALRGSFARTPLDRIGDRCAIYVALGDLSGSDEVLARWLTWAQRALTETFDPAVAMGGGRT